MIKDENDLYIILLWPGETAENSGIARATPKFTIWNSENFTPGLCLLTCHSAHGCRQGARHRNSPASWVPTFLDVAGGQEDPGRRLCAAWEVGRQHAGDAHVARTHHIANPS